MPIGKLVFLTFTLGLMSLLNACVSSPPLTPLRLSGLDYPSTGQTAYIWTSGNKFERFNLTDYATITKIDGINVPDEYLPKTGGPPVFSWLFEVPAGKHELEILYKETIPIGFCVFFILVCSENSIEVSRAIISLTAEPNRTYSPFVKDECSKNYFWIEDWGPYVTATETRRFTFEYDAVQKKTVVAGEVPPNNPCEDSSDSPIPL